jgi:transposase
MMGIKVRHFAPLVNVSLDELVSPDHFYRHLDQVLDLTFVRDLVRPCYAAGGRPSIDPVVFFKLQLVMFFEGLRSERQLLRVAADRLSVRWYLGYDFNEPLPDHSSLTHIRDRYGVAIFRRFFDAIVEQCRHAGLVWGAELYFDGTQVEANADRDRMVPRFYQEAIAKHLATLFPEAAAAVPTSVDQPLPIPFRGSAVDPSSTHDPAPSSGHNWIRALGRPPDRTITRGHYQRIADVWVSQTDPDATLMHKKGGGTCLGYHTHYGVDGGTARIILAVLVTPSEVMENQPVLDLLWQARFRWQLPVRQITGDTTYGTAEMIVALEAASIRAYVPLPDFDRRTPFFGKQAFIYDAQANTYSCPAGAVLPHHKTHFTQRVIYYRADPAICQVCPLKAKCTESAAGRMVGRSFDEEQIDRVRAYHATEAYKKAMRKRKVWVEPLFGEAKAWHGLERFRLRTLPKVNIESLLIATGQNLKRLLQRWG